MIISLIVAASDNHVIGKDNQLPWHLPVDLKYFKNTTWGLPVLMGRKTFESMGRALPGRTNIVITGNADWYAEGVIATNSIEAAVAKASETGAKEVFITGGGEIFRSAMLKAHKIYMTRVHAYVEGDIYFPMIDEKYWSLDSNKDISADEKNKFDMSFQIWTKK